MNRPWIIVSLLLAGFCGSSHGAQSASAGCWTQKQFLITFWCPPPASDEALARVAAEGFNLTWTPAEGLDAAARHRLRAMLTSNLLRPEALDDPAKRAELDALVVRVKDHPALEAYYITDEPGAGAFPGLGKLVAYLRERDPAHFAYINLFPTYANEQQLGVSADAAARARADHPQNLAGVGAGDPTVLRYREHLKRFIETIQPDLISYDHYHFFKPDANGKAVDGKEYFLNLALIRLAALEANKPFLNIIQANTIEKSWRLPNPQELRFLVFTTMAYGGRGISYFTYWGPLAYNGLYQDGQPAPLLETVAALNKEIRGFGPALMQMDSVAVYHTAPLPYGAEAIPGRAPVQIASPGEFVLGLFGQSGRTTAFMIVNRDYHREAEAIVDVALPGSRLQELDRNSGGWSGIETPGTGRAVKIRLGPGDGRLFRAVD
ncbi:MAG TPA: hypothetical protein P5555_11860 [Candidatus Paceibacterota bacterium]|nr:hypothetical protein [Verrucomicrobiota bacterium]HRZ45875.1 hypothetical protein [Candidatus Paceibacterota bacterium]HRZ92965.1 hypothetical protein [Candidatus Paceibacterota bacterium]